MKATTSVISAGFAVAWLAATTAVAATQASTHSEDETRPHVTIEGRRDVAPAVKHYVSALSGFVGLQGDDDSVQVWRGPICPLVGGLPQKEGQFIFDHLTETLASLDIRLGAVDCKPNFFVIVTTEPEALLKAVWKRNGGMFGEGVGAQHFVDTPRPVRVWYNARLMGAGGSGAQALPSQLWKDGVPAFQIETLSPRTEFGLVRVLRSVIAVVDLTKVEGLDWKQVTDYVAMAGLTNIRLDADLGDAPTLLRLFSAPPAERLMSLSPWDRAFLRSVYHTNQGSRRQRMDIVKFMVSQVTP